MKTITKASIHYETGGADVRADSRETIESIDADARIVLLANGRHYEVNDPSEFMVGSTIFDCVLTAGYARQGFRVFYVETFDSAEALLSHVASGGLKATE